ncbi:hypothetical protein EJM73_05745 [Clostridium botulinum]|uniref:Uncharacterized protein n=1 Tax=Clostridium sporogenes TaxID=1509 RepID=A0AAE6I9Y7_CLOSG|nr:MULTISPECIES: hypothetical protein [Clostridium]APQ78642.1 hypothetical protein RSJ10_3933 [Clostridium botulinum]MBN3355976.1 hypothetical protein [Clostridium botulinum]NCI20751.1 hypothetical protein [Clostridium botulinum]NCI35165.1 hypothetical protein [Clostridium botulinum]NCI74244.1 hypothetical protein [Clostridium botulinum]
MKYFNYYVNEVMWSIYILISIIAYIKKPLILLYISTSAIYFIAIQILIKAKKKESYMKIRSILDNKYEVVKIWPIYIIVFIFTILGFVQNIGVIQFSKINNLILALLMGGYNLYLNEKAHKASLNFEKTKQDYINKYGQDQFDKFEKESEDFFQKFQKEFDDIINNRNDHK